MLLSNITDNEKTEQTLKDVQEWQVHTDIKMTGISIAIWKFLKNSMAGIPGSSLAGGVRLDVFTGVKTLLEI